MEWSEAQHNTQHKSSLHTRTSQLNCFVCERVAQPQWLSVGTVPAHVVVMSFFVEVSTMQTSPWFLADSSHVRHRAGGWTVLSSVEL